MAVSCDCDCDFLQSASLTPYRCPPVRSKKSNLQRRFRDTASSAPITGDSGTYTDGGVEVAGERVLSPQDARRPIARAPRIDRNGGWRAATTPSFTPSIDLHTSSPAFIQRRKTTAIQQGIQPPTMGASHASRLLAGAYESGHVVS